MRAKISLSLSGLGPGLSIDLRLFLAWRRLWFLAEDCVSLSLLERFHLNSVPLRTSTSLFTLAGCVVAVVVVVGFGCWDA